MFVATVLPLRPLCYDPTMPQDIFDVVDERDQVIGQAPRAEVHARRLMHRAVHVFLFNSRGEFLLQMRSVHKDEHPLTYTSSCSGHVDSGETYDEAAVRELGEELGLDCELEPLQKFAATPELAMEHTMLYRAVSDDTPVIDEHEIDFVQFHPLDEVRQMLAAQPQIFSPPLRVLVGWYSQNIN